MHFLNVGIVIGIDDTYNNNDYKKLFKDIHKFYSRYGINIDVIETEKISIPAKELEKDSTQVIKYVQHRAFDWIYSGIYDNDPLNKYDLLIYSCLYKSSNTRKAVAVTQRYGKGAICVNNMFGITNYIKKLILLTHETGHGLGAHHTNEKVLNKRTIMDPSIYYYYIFYNNVEDLYLSNDFFIDIFNRLEKENILKPKLTINDNYIIEIKNHSEMTYEFNSNFEIEDLFVYFSPYKLDKYINPSLIKYLRNKKTFVRDSKLIMFHHKQNVKKLGVYSYMAKTINGFTNPIQIIVT